MTQPNQSNPTNEQELRTQIRNTLYNNEIGFSLANANGRTPEQMVEELIDALLYPVTAHTNAEIARTLDRLYEEQRTWMHEHSELNLGYATYMLSLIQAERAKLKEEK